MTDKKQKKNDISKKDLEYIKNKVKDSLFPEQINKGQVFYFRDRDSKVFTPYDIVSDNMEFINPDSDESFTLDKPVLYNGIKPVYWNIRGQTKAMEFEVKFNKENDKLVFNETLINPTEMRAVQESSARTSILKKDKMSFSQAVITLLCCIITALTVYVICSPFMYVGTIPTNSTSGV
ncbi:unnamed protein product [marine sediment metagenome]|uniref:Uncharacterized protein n=1 Tax=marine sediment metagenome TaxID=412755 RepID=X1RXT3_9ZZZZ